MSNRIKYRARWVFPIEGPPLENGVVETEDGLIAAVHDRHTPDACDLGNVALLPALINCHAHLEFSSLENPFSPSAPFTSWIKSLVAYRISRTVSPLDSIRAGLKESADNGVTLVGEIATADWPLEIDPSTSPALVVFRESLGRTPEQIETQLASARRHLELGSTCGTPQIVFGLSPHAPYSVHPVLLKELVSLAIEFDAPLAMHLAETPAELQLLQNGTGEFAEMLKSFGAWEPSMFDGSRQIIDDLRQLARSPCALVIHGNYLTDPGIELIASTPQLSVIYCPRTHHYFGHTSHPWQELIDRGINVALGTDGRGSNPDLSIWNELRFLTAKHPEIDPAKLLPLATLNGAHALRFDHRFGSIAPGKQASMISIALPESSADTPERLLFHPQSAKPIPVLINS